MNKQQVRMMVREKKRAMSADQIMAASGQLCELLVRTQAYRQAATLYGYLSYNQEVRTEPILRRAMADGKRVAVPKVYGDEMRFIYLTDLEQVHAGFAGIPEPIADGPVAQDKTALVLMPGLAFDRCGHRVGYGGGFYDRFLSKEPNHPTIALCYDFQMFPHLDTEAFDLPVDQVLWTQTEE